MSTQHYLSFLVHCLGDHRFTVLYYCHLPNDLSSKFRSYMTIFHRKLLTREGRVSANGWTHPSSMTLFVHSFIRSVVQKCYHSDIKYHMKPSIIFSVVYHIKKILFEPRALQYGHHIWYKYQHLLSYLWTSFTSLKGIDAFGIQSYRFFQDFVIHCII